MIRILSVLCCLFSGVAHAQQASNGSGAMLRVLDKITGTVQDLELPSGQTHNVGNLAIALGECRYPTGNPSGDAYALLTVIYNNQPDPIFRGWMIASAPALNAMDHQRYDVWVLRCLTS